MVHLECCSKPADLVGSHLQEIIIQSTQKDKKNMETNIPLQTIYTLSSPTVLKG